MAYYIQRKPTILVCTLGAAAVTKPEPEPEPELEPGINFDSAGLRDGDLDAAWGGGRDR